MKNEKLKNFFSSKAARSAVVIVAVLLIGLAVYLNYRWFYDPMGSIGFGQNNMDDNDDSSQITGGESSGEVSNYFTATALNREQARDEAIEVLKMVSESEDATEAARAEASEKISKIAVDIQNEINIETLVKAKGFEECIAVISEESVSVIVSAESIQANEAAQIMTIVYETTGILPENVSIVNR